MMEEGIGVDRISELAEPILHHIQSLLLLNQAATRSALSKTWNTVWNTLPFLNFDDKSCFLPRYRHFYYAKNEKLIAFIDKTLNRRIKQGVRIEKLGLHAKDLDLSGHLDRWIGCLTVCNIDELTIQHYNFDHILLPPSLFTIESLTSLSLEGCKLPRLAIEQVKLPNLRKLSLEFVYMDD